MLLLVAAPWLAAAAGTCPTIQCDQTGATSYPPGSEKQGNWATALGLGTNASGFGSTAMGVMTKALGYYTTTMGTSTIASKHGSVAMGGYTEASGTESTATGYMTQASGDTSFTMGDSTKASGTWAVAMGYFTEAKEDQSLAVSGNVYANNIHVMADVRVVSNVTTASPEAMLRSVQRLRVVEHQRTDNYCASHDDDAKCAAQRTMGLLAHEVAAVIPQAVVSGTSLTLTGPRNTKTRQVLEKVEDVQSLDMHAMVAHLVGAVQAQSQQIEAQAEEIREQAKQIEALVNNRPMAGYRP